MNEPGLARLTQKSGATEKPAQLATRKPSAPMVTKLWDPKASYPTKRAQIAATGGLGLLSDPGAEWSGHHKSKQHWTSIVQKGREPAAQKRTYVASMAYFGYEVIFK